MKKVLLLFVLVGFGLGLSAQQVDVFDRVEKQFPEIPHGLLRAISLTNTQGHHLTDADYSFDVDDPSAMPRAYGMMGLVKNGKGCFRENLPLVAKLSGISEEAILSDPETNVTAYAKAMVMVAEELRVSMDTPESCIPLIQELSELPLREEKDELPMMMMLYSVYHYLGSDLKSLFKEDYEMLSSTGLSFSKETDYPEALWVPAPECNFEERTKPISGVVIHYTEGSYAGCISWFQNCDSQVSAHYVIRSFDGQVTQMVRERDKAWHARTANGYTIGIEHEAYGDIISFFTEAMYASSSRLVRDICSRYESIDGHRTFYFDTLDNGMALNTGLHDLGGETACIKIRGHQHYPDQSHTDPGPYWDWNYYYKKINEGTPITYLGGAGVEEGTLNHLNYGDDERRIWLIQSAVNTAITLTFSSFDLEKDYDFLWIYDGSNVYAPKIGRWNTHSPGSVTSSGNTLCVEFRSDCATSAGGWRANWKVSHADVASSDEQVPIIVTPNPADDHIKVSLSSDDQFEVKVFDVVGRVFFQTTEQSPLTIDVSRWPRGIYTLQCTSQTTGARFVERIIH
jgi:N-acetyl-anhydromuramyl-L-alanine amidase AmpD